MFGSVNLLTINSGWFLNAPNLDETLTIRPFFVKKGIIEFVNFMVPKLKNSYHKCLSS